MKNRLKFTTVALIGICLLLTGCYKEERFTMPGTGDYTEPGRDSMPNPFDGSNLVYLIKDGVPDFTRMSVMGFTDFAVEMPANADNSSWYTGKDAMGNMFYGCRQHRNFYAVDNSNHFGGNQLSYQYNALISRLFMENGTGKNWKISARLSFDVLSRNSQSLFSFEGSQGWGNRFSLMCDWTSAFCMIRKSALVNPLEGGNSIGCIRFYAQGDPVDIEICCVNNQYYVNMNKETMWSALIEDSKAHAFPLIFRPWMSGVRFYNLSIEGDYVMPESVGVQHENGYVTIQAPALAKTDNSVLLFAEGRYENMVQSARLTSVRSNATDIIVKRSSDNGDSWSGWSTVLGGDRGVYLRPEVIDAGDKLYLFYTVDVTGAQDGNYRIEYLVSSDGGNSWNAGNPVNVDLEGYAISTLSGHGLKTVDNRLVLPVQCRTGKKGSVALLYSEDNGATWQLGDLVEGLRNVSASLVEDNGTLTMFVSHTSTGTSRKMVKSVDGGKTWSAPVDATIPTGNYGYQAYGATVRADDGKIYHFTSTGVDKTSSFGGSSVSTDPVVGPTNQKRFYIYRPEYDQHGKGLTMTVSEDGGNKWGTAKDLVGFTSYAEYGFPTGAMDAAIAGNRILVVVESGSTVPYEGLLIFKETR